MGKQASKAAEMAHGSGIDALKVATAEFMQAWEGTREQALAFEGILRALASYERRGRCPRDRQEPWEAAWRHPFQTGEGHGRGNARRQRRT
jgi:hypothetical protein